MDALRARIIGLVILAVVSVGLNVTLVSKLNAERDQFAISIHELDRRMAVHEKGDAQARAFYSDVVDHWRDAADKMSKQAANYKKLADEARWNYLHCQ